MNVIGLNFTTKPCTLSRITLMIRWNGRVASAHCTRKHLFYRPVSFLILIHYNNTNYNDSPAAGRSLASAGQHLRLGLLSVELSLLLGLLLSLVLLHGGAPGHALLLLGRLLLRLVRLAVAARRTAKKKSINDQ